MFLNKDKYLESLFFILKGRAPSQKELDFFLSRYDMSTALESENPNKTFIHNSGRFYCYTNNRWVTDSDDNYGGNNHNFNENSGTAASPTIEWEHLGIPIKGGVTLKSLNMVGKANNNQVDDLEIVVALRKPSSPNSYQTGLDNDNEYETQEVYRGFWKNAVGNFLGAMSDKHAAFIDIDYQINEPCELSLYVRPVGNLAVTRYFSASWTWELV